MTTNSFTFLSKTHCYVDWLEKTILSKGWWFNYLVLQLTEQETTGCFISKSQCKLWWTNINTSFYHSNSLAQCGYQLCQWQLGVETSFFYKTDFYGNQQYVVRLGESHWTFGLDYLENVPKYIYIGKSLRYLKDLLRM